MDVFLRLAPCVRAWGTGSAVFSHVAALDAALTSLRTVWSENETLPLKSEVQNRRFREDLSYR